MDKSEMKSTVDGEEDINDLIRKDDTRSAPSAAPSPKPKKVVDSVVESAPLFCRKTRRLSRPLSPAPLPPTPLNLSSATAAVPTLSGGRPCRGSPASPSMGYLWMVSIIIPFWGSAARCPLIPVGIAGPLFLEGREYSVPMATIEQCLLANTNSGCKATYASGGATSILLKDGTTRALVVRFSIVRSAANLKFFLNLYDWMVVGENW
ncbi:hypothetical protein RJ639_010811 [Escallonia herrerae]|uniref:Uncharacterized protein n=1 Tax=Escallonia herrerae TaxID=1293975 RepID=A0AA88VME5_9ASTE|nr:hypothetical protein RJ639_010811 [Escallonia herrerae]